MYRVKYGFIKLGTVVISNKGAAPEYGANKYRTHMQFWTAQVPMLNSKSVVNSVMDTREMYVAHFDEKSQADDKITHRHFDYDHEKRTLTYSDDTKTNEVTPEMVPFNDALTLLYNMRVWSASGTSYCFTMKGADGNKKAICRFSTTTEKTECAALDDKEIRTRVVHGHVDMGKSTVLGANGDFTAYISDDEAAIPIRIDMSIAIGSISLILDKVKHPGWVGTN